MSPDMSFLFSSKSPPHPLSKKINYIHTYLKNIFHPTVPTYQHTNKIFIFQHTKQPIILYINYLEDNINIIRVVLVCWYLVGICWYAFSCLLVHFC